MLSALVHLLVLLCAQPAADQTPKGLLAAALPRCAAGVARCAAVRLWIAPPSAATGEDFDDVAFLTTQLEHANAHHAGAGLGFEVVEIMTLPATAAAIVTRSERDALGHDRWQRGLVDVFVVSSLANVDDPGHIRGVHWRSRAARERRWVILSRISPPRVLAHELGHYFGLAHSTVPASLMNTSGNALADRRFLAGELTTIERRARRLFAQGVITDPRDRGQADTARPGSLRSTQ